MNEVLQLLVPTQEKLTLPYYLGINEFHLDPEMVERIGRLAQDGSVAAVQIAFAFVEWHHGDVSAALRSNRSLMHSPIEAIFERLKGMGLHLHREVQVSPALRPPLRASARACRQLLLFSGDLLSVHYKTAQRRS